MAGKFGMLGTSKWCSLFFQSCGESRTHIRCGVKYDNQSIRKLAFIKEVQPTAKNSAKNIYDRKHVFHKKTHIASNVPDTNSNLLRIYMQTAQVYFTLNSSLDKSVLVSGRTNI